MGLGLGLGLRVRVRLGFVLQYGVRVKFCVWNCFTTGLNFVMRLRLCFSYWKTGFEKTGFFSALTSKL